MIAFCYVLHSIPRFLELGLYYLDVSHIWQEGSPVVICAAADVKTLLLSQSLLAVSFFIPF